MAVNLDPVVDEIRKSPGSEISVVDAWTLFPGSGGNASRTGDPAVAPDGRLYEPEGGLYEPDVTELSSTVRCST